MSKIIQDEVITRHAIIPPSSDNQEKPTKPKVLPKPRVASMLDCSGNKSSILYNRKMDHNVQNVKQFVSLFERTNTVQQLPKTVTSFRKNNSVSHHNSMLLPNRPLVAVKCNGKYTPQNEITSDLFKDNSYMSDGKEFNSLNFDHRQNPSFISPNHTLSSPQEKPRWKTRSNSLSVPELTQFFTRRLSLSEIESNATDSQAHSASQNPKEKQAHVVSDKMSPCAMSTPLCLSIATARTEDEQILRIKPSVETNNNDKSDIDSLNNIIYQLCTSLKTCYTTKKQFPILNSFKNLLFFELNHRRCIEFVMLLQSCNVEYDINNCRHLFTQFFAAMTRPLTTNAEDLCNELVTAIKQKAAILEAQLLQTNCKEETDLEANLVKIRKLCQTENYKSLANLILKIEGFHREVVTCVNLICLIAKRYVKQICELNDPEFPVLKNQIEENLIAIEVQLAESRQCKKRLYEKQSLLLNCLHDIISPEDLLQNEINSNWLFDGIWSVQIDKNIYQENLLQHNNFLKLVITTTQTNG